MSTRISKKSVEYQNNILLKVIATVITITLILQTGLGIWYFLFKDNEKVVVIDQEDIQKDDSNYFGLGDTFTFDGLEITIGNSYSLLRVGNTYSSYYNKIVVRLPVTVKNTKQGNYMLNIYDYKITGPDGSERDEVAGYFTETLFYADTLAPNAKYTKYLYFLYDSNGNYSIKFNNGIEKKYVTFNVEYKNNLKSYEEIKEKEEKSFKL